MSNAPHILPFEALIRRLQRQHFAVGVDTHIHIRELLDGWQGGDEKELDRLKVQLGLIVARDEEEQKHFYKIFENYQKYYLEQKRPESFTEKSWWNRSRLKLFFVGLALVVIGVLFVIGLELSKGVTAKIAWQQQKGTNILWVEDQSKAFNFWPFVQDSVTHKKLEIQGFGDLDRIGNFNRIELPKEGLYQLRLEVQSTKGKDTLFQSIDLKPRIQATIASNQIDTSTTYFFKANVFYPQVDTSGSSPNLKSQLSSLQAPELKGEFTWSLNDANVLAQGLGLDTLRERFQVGRNTVTVQYRQGADADLIRTSAREEIVVEAARSPLEAVPVPLSDIPLEEVLMDDYLKDDPSMPIWPYLVALGWLMLFGLFEVYRYVSRKPMLDASRQHGEPLDHELRIPPAEWSLFDSEDFDEAALKLRARLQGEAQELDIHATISNTIEAGGMPTFAWKHTDQAPQYLFLIQSRAYEDQLARYFQALVLSFQARDISAESYFYEESFNECKKNLGEEGIELGRLASEYSNYHLVVIGDGEGFFRRGFSRKNPHNHLFLAWKHRAFLSTKATEDWSWREALIEEQMPVLPATEKGLIALTDQWQEGIKPNYKAWKQSYLSPAPPNMDDPELLEELRAYLGPHGFQWLCACTVYHELYYELSLRFGEIIMQRNEIHQAMMPLNRLLSLPWFRTGKFPRQIRLRLYRELEPELAKAIRTELIHILSRHENRAPAGSFARKQQETTLAIYEYMNSDKQHEDKVKLQKVVLKVKRIRDAVSLESIGNESTNPFAIVLPRKAFRNNIKLQGTKTAVRISLWLTPLLLFLLGAWWCLSPLHDPNEPLPLPEIRFELAETAQDTARYLAYAGYWEHQKSILAYGSLEKAVQKDSALAIAKANLAKAKFNRAKYFYDQQKYVQALEQFESCCPDTVKVASAYTSGLCQMQVGAFEAGITHLHSLGQAWYDHSSAQTSLFLQEAIAAERLHDQLLYVYSRVGKTSQDNINTLMTWMGQERLDIPILLRRADSLYNKKKYELAFQNYKEVLLQDANNARAIIGRENCKREIELLELQVLIQLADSLFQVKEWTLAKFNYEKVLGLDKGNDIARQRLEICNEKITAPVVDSTLFIPAFILINTETDQAIKSIQDGEQINLGTLGLKRPNVNIQAVIEGSTPDSVIFFLNGGKIPTPERAAPFTLGVDVAGDFSPTAFLQEGPQSLQAIPYANGIPGMSLEIKFTLIDAVELPDLPLPELRLVQGGTFEMGSNDGDPDEKPVHEVTVNDFEIGLYEVTNLEYTYFLNQTKPVEDSLNKWINLKGTRNRITNTDSIYQVDSGYENHPVVYVTWHGARAYCAWGGYRLPTEAEWEYAARGGNLSKDYVYAGSNNIDSVGWYYTGSSSALRPIGLKLGNELGIYDMSGNVWEWCQDLWHKNYENAPDDGRAWEEGNSSNRVSRGGGWSSNASYCRVAYRHVWHPAVQSADLGFRVARTP